MRTTPEAVAGIVEVDEGLLLSPFIATANELVTEFCVPSGYTAARLELIERWLAAHFYAIRDPRPSKQAASDASQSWFEDIGRGLNGSVWGQQALRLDTKGGLARMDSEIGKARIRANVSYMGTVPETTEE